MKTPAIAAAAALGVLACGPSAGSSDAGPDAGSPQQVCADKAQATCNLRNLCSTGWLISTEYGDMTTCVSRTLAAQMKFRTRLTSGTITAYPASGSKYPR